MVNVFLCSKIYPLRVVTEVTVKNSLLKWTTSKFRGGVK